MNTPPTLNVEDSEALLDALLDQNAPYKTKLKGIRNYLLGCLMLEAGLRVGETVQLLLEDLYFSDRPVTSIVVREAIAKTKRERSVPVSNKLRTALEEYLSNCFVGISRAGFRYAFPDGSATGYITTRQVERIINNVAMKVLGRPVNPHVLRHTFASRLMRVTNMRTVQELLGHKNLSSTQIYTHPNEEDKKQAILEMAVRSTPVDNDDLGGS